MDSSSYHVMLAGRKAGPYDRRTIVGMRIKKALTSEHVLIGADGAHLTVADLIGKPAPETFNANRSTVLSVVRATFTAALVAADRGFGIPRFKGEVEARVQSDVLRLAGRFRRGMGWKEGRVKVPLQDIVHARVKSSHAELWIRSAANAKLHRVVLELFTPMAAGDFVEWLPNATAPEGHEAGRAPEAGAMYTPWIAIGAIALVVGVLLMVLLWPRVH